MGDSYRYQTAPTTRDGLRDALHHGIARRHEGQQVAAGHDLEAVVEAVDDIAGRRGWSSFMVSVRGYEAPAMTNLDVSVYRAQQGDEIFDPDGAQWVKP